MATHTTTNDLNAHTPIDNKITENKATDYQATVWTIAD